LRFQGGIAVFPTKAEENKKAIYAVTTDGRLAQIWDTTTWNVDFPAEVAGPAGLRFQGGIAGIAVPPAPASGAVFPTKAEENKKDIYAITTDGRLAQIWDTNQWNLDFPAELAGSTGLRF
jgi:hypothetical protein